MVEEGPNQLNERSFIPRKHVILADFFIENIPFSCKRWIQMAWFKVKGKGPFKPFSDDFPQIQQM